MAYESCLGSLGKMRSETRLKIKKGLVMYFVQGLASLIHPYGVGEDGEHLKESLLEIVMRVQHFSIADSCS